MSILTWDDVGSRQFETGLDRGVLYLEDGSGVSWNGLVSVSEKTSTTAEALYFDGRKFNDVVVPGDYAAELSAFTYPDEFSRYEGVLEVGNGLSFYDQRLPRFGLSYRTKIGNDLDPEAGYKIHVIYNLIAIPSDIDYGSVSDTISPVTFKWNLTAVPTDEPGYEPTAHFMIDTTKAPSGLITAVEGKLYGNDFVDAFLPDLSYFLNISTQDW